MTGCSTSPPLLWRGDFETNDFSQWAYLLNPQGLSIEKTCVYDGEYAGRVTINGNADMLWQGNRYLNRSEFSYQPAADLIGEGKETFFGWSFYLETPLTDEKHEIGYWESTKHYQQMLRFNIVGQDFSFQASAQPTPFWTKKNFARAGIWRDVALHIYWSTDANKGFVKVWLDGKYMGEENFATLYAADENMFTQIGILRTQEETVESILIDNVHHGANIESVMKTFNNKRSKYCN